MKRKFLRSFCIAVVGAILGTSSPWAQVDLAKSLVGKWEGEVTWAGSAGSVAADPNRTLIIDAVTQKDGKWVATGRYGITGKGLGKVDIAVDEGGSRLSIQFTGPTQTVQLSLVGPRDLTGTVTFVDRSIRGGRPLRLEKKD